MSKKFYSGGGEKYQFSFTRYMGNKLNQIYRSVFFMKKIVLIVSIFAIMMSLCVTSFANDLVEDEEIRGDFIYEKGTNNILGVCGITIFVKYLRKIQICWFKSYISSKQHTAIKN